LTGCSASKGKCQMFAGLICTLVLLTTACASRPGEFDDEGVVAGQVVYFTCTKSTPPVCRRVPMPRRVWYNTTTGVGVKGEKLGSPHDISGFGFSGSDGHFGDGYVPEGRWQFRVTTPLARPGCDPRPTFDITKKMFYEIRFRFAAAGDCSATVWEQPLGLQHPEQRKVVARAGSG
jgi:hypothetical protein